LNLDFNGNSKAEINYYNSILVPFIKEYNKCFGEFLEKTYPTQPKPILALEFEWVIAVARKIRVVNELDFIPVNGSIEFCQEAVKCYDVCVYSNSKNRLWEIYRMKQWLRMNNFPYQIRFPLKKPNAFITIDTNSRHFNGSSVAFKEFEECNWFRMTSDEFEKIIKNHMNDEFPLHLWFRDHYEKRQTENIKKNNCGDTQEDQTETGIEELSNIDVDPEEMEMSGEDEKVVIKAIQDYLESREEEWQEWTMEKVMEETGYQWWKFQAEHERELENRLPEDVSPERKNKERLQLWAKSVYECIDKDWRKNLRKQVDMYGEIDDMGV
jgi:hypothetical protein